jgi:hypothetical protein
VSPLSRVVLVLGRQKIKLVYDVIILASTIAVFVLAHHGKWSVTMAIAALAGVNTVAYGIFYLLLLNMSSTHVWATSHPIEELQ